MSSKPSIQKSLDSYKETTVLQDFQSLQGKVIVVTGGGRGIGVALVKGILEVGGYVAVMGIDKQAGPELLEIQALVGANVRYFATDVSDERLLRRAFDSVLEDFGRIDGLIACAGICVEKPFLDHTWEEMSNLLSVNAVGLFFCAQYAARAMIKNSGDKYGASKGSIVFIGSICPRMGLEGQGLSAYSASKGAVKGLCHPLAVELAPLGIRVNTITPGHTVTDMSVSQFAFRPDLEGIMRQACPMGRMGERRDLKGAAVYFLSDASLYTTGADLVVSGGIHAGRL